MPSPIGRHNSRLEVFESLEPSIVVDWRLEGIGGSLNFFVICFHSRHYAFSPPTESSRKRVMDLLLGRLRFVWSETDGPVQDALRLSVGLLVTVLCASNFVEMFSISVGRPDPKDCDQFTFLLDQPVICGWPSSTVSGAASDFIRMRSASCLNRTAEGCSGPRLFHESAQVHSIALHATFSILLFLGTTVLSLMPASLACIFNQEWGIVQPRGVRRWLASFCFTLAIICFSSYAFTVSMNQSSPLLICRPNIVDAYGEIIPHGTLIQGGCLIELQNKSELTLANEIAAGCPRSRVLRKGEMSPFSPFFSKSHFSSKYALLLEPRPSEKVLKRVEEIKRNAMVRYCVTISIAFLQLVFLAVFNVRVFRIADAAELVKRRPSACSCCIQPHLEEHFPEPIATLTLSYLELVHCDRDAHRFKAGN